MLGLLWEARAVADSVALGDAALNGFVYLDEGGTRKAYLGPSGTVYKLEHSGYESLSNSEAYGNFCEQETWEFLSLIAPEIVPDHYLYVFGNTTVMAVEYLPGDVSEKEAWGFCRDIFNKYRLRIHDSDGASAFNFRKRADGSIMACDAGCGAQSVNENLNFEAGAWF